MPATDTRAFDVHAAHEGRHARHRVEGRSFEDAALAFADQWGAATPDGDLQVIVRDADDGREHCFTIDLGDGAARSCD